jgi:hypothetical protein
MFCFWFRIFKEMILMKKVRFIRILSFWSLVLVLALTITTSWLPVGASASDGIEAIGQQSSIGSSSDIARVDFAYKTAAAGTTKSTGYKLTGVKWKTLPVTYAFNPTNENSALSDSQIAAILALSTQAWDNETGETLFTGNSPVTTNKPYGVLDGTNTVAFGNLGTSGTIAVTTYWYNRKTREIVEFDMCFNTYYAWGDATQTSQQVMDIQNIATHEFGHAIGLADLYQAAFDFVTMYGYADYNQTNKRTLEPQDIAGLEKIYGP